MVWRWLCGRGPGLVLCPWFPLKADGASQDPVSLTPGLFLCWDGGVDMIGHYPVEGWRMWVFVAVTVTVGIIGLGLIVVANGA